MTALRQQMDADMVVRGMAVKTREAYLAAVVGLARYYQRSPDQISEAEVQTYLLHLIRERKRAWSTCNIAVHGLRFFYHVTLKRDRTTFTIPASRQPAKVPHILSTDDVRRILAATANPKHHVMLATTYAAGLRLNELVHLRVMDIDSARMTIRVEQGKGAKDRYTLLSVRLLDELRTYWHQDRPRTWLFAARGADRPLDPSGIQRAYTAAKRRAGITKPGGIHGLRHAFATHLLEAGVDIHTIQRLLGHRALSTTSHYFHLAHPTLLAHRSPLDLLDGPATPAPPAQA
jgi:integrase/recombinase XerD